MILVEQLENKKEVMNMQKCYFCGGKVIEKRIRHVHHWGDEIVIFENVLADVCTQCGEVYLAPEVLKAMDKATLEKRTPDKSLKVPVFSLA